MKVHEIRGRLQAIRETALDLVRQAEAGVDPRRAAMARGLFQAHFVPLDLIQAQLASHADDAELPGVDLALANIAASLENARQTLTEPSPIGDA